MSKLRLSALFLLLCLFSIAVPRASAAPECEKIWKLCWAHCTASPDASTCYDRCMAFHGCR